MHAGARTRRSTNRTEDGTAAVRPSIAPGVAVVLRRPWRLRGTTAIVRRRVTSGWEVEVRSPLGTPLHLTLPARALRVR